MRVNEITEQVHALAREKGWHDGTPRTNLEIQMLIVSEIAEACEEARKGTPPIYKEHYDNAGNFSPSVPGSYGWAIPSKPEGEAIEMADAVIRIMDYFACKGWNLEDAINIKHEYNKSRPYRHGGKLK